MNLIRFLTKSDFMNFYWMEIIILNQIFKFSNKITFESFKNNLLYEFNNNF